jgi:serine/threonine protein phosphatase PrpC
MPATWTALSASVRGSLHESLGKLNQDAVRIHRAADSIFLAVADGHGNTRSFRSDRGSALATECAVRALRDLMWRNGVDGRLSSIRRQMERRLPQAIINHWHRAVREDIARDPFSPLDFAAFPDKAPVLKPGHDLPFAAYLAYGATLIVAAMTPRFVAYAQLGDGDILLVNQDGTVSRPWTREYEFFSTETISLCSHYAAQSFRVRVEPRRAQGPAVVVLATDGYANCFGDDEAFFTVGSDLLTYLRQEGTAFVQERLAHWLSESSRDGSRDDITVGLGARLNALQ